jgi:hypothetical protein
MYNWGPTKFGKYYKQHKNDMSLLPAETADYINQYKALERGGTPQPEVFPARPASAIGGQRIFDAPKPKKARRK